MYEDACIHPNTEGKPEVWMLGSGRPSQKPTPVEGRWKAMNQAYTERKHMLVSPAGAMQDEFMPYQLSMVG